MFATSAAAFETQDYVDTVVDFVSICTVHSRVTATEAYVFLRHERFGDYYAGGNKFENGVPLGQQYSIDVRVIADCFGITNELNTIENVQQNGADFGSIDADNYIGFSFDTGPFFGAEAGMVANQTYEFKVGRGTLESNIPVITGPTVEETQTEVLSFMQTRANQVMAAQPDLIGLMSGAASGAFNVQATQSNGIVDLATSGDRNVWASLQGTWSKFDEAEASYVFGAVGGHTQIGANAIAGFMLQFDQAEQTQGDASTSGTGFLAGPYLVAKLPDQPLYFEARLLGGVTRNEVDVDGETPEDFDTTRALASGKVAGDLEYGALTLTPSLTATHMSETQDAFTDSAGDEIPKQTLTMTDVALGLDAAQDVMLDGGVLTVTGGLAVVWTSTDGSGFAEDTVASFKGERGRVHLGVSYELDSGMVLSAGTSVDGLGSAGFESASASFGLQKRF